jgi:hypothetical protein
MQESAVSIRQKIDARHKPSIQNPRRYNDADIRHTDGVNARSQQS